MTIVLTDNVLFLKPCEVGNVHMYGYTKQLKEKTLMINSQNINQEIGVLVKLILEIKACVRYFLKFFCLAPNESPSKTMKDVFYFI